MLADYGFKMTSRYPEKRAFLDDNEPWVFDLGFL